MIRRMRLAQVWPRLVQRFVTRFDAQKVIIVTEDQKVWKVEECRSI